MFELLENIININSYSSNKKGVNKVVDVLEAEFRDMGFATRRQQRDTTGDNLVAESPLRAKGGGLLMIGHMDTVFPPEMGFDTYKKRRRYHLRSGRIRHEGRPGCRNLRGQGHAGRRFAGLDPGGIRL